MSHVSQPQKKSICVKPSFLTSQCETTGKKILVPSNLRILHSIIYPLKRKELRSRRAQFIYYDRNYNRIRLQRWGHAPNRLPVKKLRRLLHKRREVRVFA